MESQGLRSGRIRVLSGPVNATKTGRLWLDWARHRRGAPIAFHFERDPEDEFQELLERYSTSQFPIELTHDDWLTIVESHRKSHQVITNAPVSGSKAITDPRTIYDDVDPDKNRVVIVDDAHLLLGESDELVEICEQLASQGILVIVGAWDTDPSGNPIEGIGRLMCRAEELVKCDYSCMYCDSAAELPATRTVLTDHNGFVRGSDFLTHYDVGGFHAACRHHHELLHRIGLNKKLREVKALVSSTPAPSDHATLTVISGPMFSGKTRELLQRTEDAQMSGGQLLAFKGLVESEVRGKSGSPVALSTHEFQYVHGGLMREAIGVTRAGEIEGFLSDSTEMVLIDRAQFLPGLPAVCRSLLRRGCQVLVSGIDLDFRGEPFGDMPELLALADQAMKLNGVCKKCGSPWGSRTQRFAEPGGRTGVATASDPLIRLGGEDLYETRCRSCHDISGMTSRFA